MRFVALFCFWLFCRVAVAREVRPAYLEVRLSGPEMYDALWKAPALQQMVVMGHSQGGLLTKLTVIHSGTRFWENISATPFDELTMEPETRELLRHSLFLEPLPFVKQVIFVASRTGGATWLGFS